MKLDLSDSLTTLLTDLAQAASESGTADALSLLASDESTRTSFIGLCRELRESGAAELALVEFGPVKGEMLTVLADPNEPGDWPVWNILVSADSSHGH